MFLDLRATTCETCIITDNYKHLYFNANGNYCMGSSIRHKKQFEMVCSNGFKNILLFICLIRSCFQHYITKRLEQTAESRGQETKGSDSIEIKGVASPTALIHSALWIDKGGLFDKRSYAAF